MILAKNFDPYAIERHWYPIWENSGYFKPDYSAKGQPYCIQLPPPNVTGTLHMGHAFQHTIMDILIRYHRMLGDNVLWQPGTDHAGIATQLIVERQLESLNLSRQQLGRAAFLEKVWEWKSQSGTIITQQMRRLGASCDWSRERFTMDPGLCNVVQKVFVALYEKGFIYRGKRLVNWDPQMGTAVSDLEVIATEENGHIWHIRYPLLDGSGHLTIATTRPETLLGDVAVAVHPTDQRYTHLIGKQLIVPLINRPIPIIADPAIDPTFGTGCVKITPAHDFNDYQIGQNHQLALLNIFTLTGHIETPFPSNYQGMERFVARQHIVSDLEKQGYLAAIYPHKLMIPRAERSGAIIEPMLTNQWFLRMEDFAKDALACVANNHIRFVPEQWKNTYNQWLNHIQDWCISRQLWWGHRIPAWYDAAGNIYVAQNKEAAIEQAGHEAITQDEDVLDTWFSSALWCFSTLGWPESTPELATFLPSNVLVTGFDIIFFWVARMIMLTHPFTQQLPFQEVYITGLVRDAQGNKMSKSKGNIIDPIDLIDGITPEDLCIKRTQSLINPKQKTQIVNQTLEDYPKGFPAFGADALRFTFASLATQGRDIRFDINRIAGYRNFCNKLWNASRFILMHIDAIQETANISDLIFADRWIISRLQQVSHAMRTAFETYRFDFAARTIYEFVWDEYCSWYVEIAKVRLQSTATQAARFSTRQTLLHVLEATLRLAHPIMPFITEEIWQTIAPLTDNKTTDSIMLAPYPIADVNKIDQDSVEQMEVLKTITTAVRNLRGEMHLSPAEKVPLYIEGNSADLSIYLPYLTHLAKLSAVYVVASLPNTQCPVAIAGNYRLLLQVEIDQEKEKARLEKERDRLSQEIKRAQSKMNNPAFIDNAPAAIVSQEQARLQAFNESYIKIQNQLTAMQSNTHSINDTFSY